MRITGLRSSLLEDQKVRGMRLARKYLSQLAPFGNVQMFLVAEATGRIPIRGCISVWVQQPRWTKLRSCGPAERSRRLQFRKWIRSLRWMKLRVYRPPSRTFNRTTETRGHQEVKSTTKGQKRKA